MPPIWKKHTNKFGEDSGGSCYLTIKFCAPNRHLPNFCVFKRASTTVQASTHTHRWLSSSFGWLEVVRTTVKFSRWSRNSLQQNHLLPPSQKKTQKNTEKQTTNARTGGSKLVIPLPPIAGWCQLQWFLNWFVGVLHSGRSWGKGILNFG